MGPTKPRAPVPWRPPPSHDAFEMGATLSHSGVQEVTREEDAHADELVAGIISLWGAARRDPPCLETV